MKREHPLFVSSRNSINPMHRIPAILLLMLMGCQSPGLKNPFAIPSDCQSSAVPQSCNEEGCSEENCESCGHSNWFCSHGYCVHGRHAHYHRMPDNYWTKSAARKRAQAELKQLSKNQCLNCDYRLGYEQAFVDVSLGADGQVPVLPPANYWKKCARTPEGHQKVQQWFSGYAAGAAYATSIYEPYNKVAHSLSDGENWSGTDGRPDYRY